jgi:competence ComEA-like helix-hairpin-helix protein
MGGLFTRDERAVVVFIAVSLTVGSLVMAARRVDPWVTGAVPPAAADSSQAARPAEAPEWPIDVNRASADELVALPGIGPARAEAIVALRDARGGLGSLDELLDVKGIGPKTLERLRPFAAAGPRGSRADTSGGRAPKTGGGD